MYLVVQTLNASPLESWRPKWEKWPYVSVCSIFSNKMMAQVWLGRYFALVLTTSVLFFGDIDTFARAKLSAVRLSESTRKYTKYLLGWRILFSIFHTVFTYVQPLWLLQLDHNKRKDSSLSSGWWVYVRKLVSRLYSHSKYTYYSRAVFLGNICPEKFIALFGAQYLYSTFTNGLLIRLWLIESRPI